MKFFDVITFQRITAEVRLLLAPRRMPRRHPTGSPKTPRVCVSVGMCSSMQLCLVAVSQNTQKERKDGTPGRRQGAHRKEKVGGRVININA